MMNGEYEYMKKENELYRSGFHVTRFYKK